MILVGEDRRTVLINIMEAAFCDGDIWLEAQAADIEQSLVICIGLGANTERIVATLTARLASPGVLDRAPTRRIVTLLWSLAFLSGVTDSAISALAARILSTDVRRELTVMNIATIVWSLATLRYASVSKLLQHAR